MKSKLDRQLHLIEEIAEKKNDDISKLYYDKYYYLFEILIKFLKGKDILIYGGYAINSVLPAKYKFYKPFELPDIDAYSYNVKSLTNEIIHHFKDTHKIQLITTKEALHENTYKIYVEGVQLMDISKISKSDYASLNQNSIKLDNGLRSVSIDYLKYTIHLLSAESEVAYRWSKVYERMLILYEVYPVKYPCKLSLVDYYVLLPEKIKTDLNAYIAKEHLPSFGWDTINMYLADDKLYQSHKVDGGFPVHYILYNGDLSVIGKSMLDAFKNPAIKIVERYTGDVFLPAYIVLGYQGEKFCYIFNTYSCLSVVDISKQEKLLSIHSIITMLYAMYFSSGSTDLLCIIQFLVAALFKNLLSRKKLFENFSLKCYGEIKGIITMRREKEIRNLLKNKNKNKNKNVYKK